MEEVEPEVIEAAEEGSKRSANAEGEGPQVGAAVKAANGEIYTGSVVLTEDGHQSIHAERLAVAKAVIATREPNPILQVAVHLSFAVDEESTHARLCGSCLHFISEFSNGDIPISVTHMTGVRQTSLHELYPEPWTKSPEHGQYGNTPQ